jgi:hypothetical protein
MNSTAPIVAKTPQEIASSRTLETFLIALIPAAVIALGSLQADFSHCVVPDGVAITNPVAVGCVIHWNVALFAFAGAACTGLINGLTAFASALQNAHENNAAAIATVTVPPVTPVP